MYLYIIFVENRRDIRQFLRGRFEGATIFPTLGFWRGLEESSSAIMIFSRKKRDGEIHTLLHHMRLKNQQASVISMKMLGEALWDGSGAIG